VTLAPVGSSETIAAACRNSDLVVEDFASKAGPDLLAFDGEIKPRAKRESKTRL
jgi:hypothetical protein